LAKSSADTPCEARKARAAFSVAARSTRPPWMTESGLPYW